ncbi:MAG: DinB family protein [Candidatus Limnocylindria bacterium]
MGQDTFAERNRAELERLRALLERVNDGELRRPVNESWTVAGVLGHIAFWDGRALFLARKVLDDRPFTSSDDEPEDVDWINDSTRPLIHAIPPRAAAELALRIAEETDALIASLPPDLVARAWPADPSSPLNPLRASHRGEHLDEIEVALR